MYSHPSNEGTLRSAARVRASELIDRGITNARDENLGDVKDIVLTSDNRRIAYVVVAFGGFLGMGEKHFAMPWRMIVVSRGTADTKPRITLAIEREELKAAPGFDKTKWPDMADMTWSRQVDEYYVNRGVTQRPDAALHSDTFGTLYVESPTGNSTGRDPDSQAFHYRRMSQLIGMDVVDGNREMVAKLYDLILDAERAEIDGAALSFGGVLGIGKNVALVPIESLTLDRGTGTFFMPCTSADLEALTLPGGEWPVLENGDWLDRGRHLCGLVHARREQGGE